MLRQGIARGAWYVTLAPALITGAMITAGLSGEGVKPERTAVGREVRRAAAETHPTARVACPAPRTLRLRRFEDGSAQLLCRDRVLVRVSVPG